MCVRKVMSEIEIKETYCPATPLPMIERPRPDYYSGGKMVEKMVNHFI